MQEEATPNGEFHHFQLVDSNGEIPVSITVLVHYHSKRSVTIGEDPITANDIIAFHERLQQFDGDYIKAITQK